MAAPMRIAAVASVLMAVAACSAEAEPEPEPARTEVTTAAGGDAGGGERDDAPTSGPGTGDLAMVGTLTRAGAPVAGADVVATIWPDDLASIKVGESVETQDVARDVTDARGRFRLSIDADTITSAYMPADQDFLNVDITAAGSGFFGQTANTIHRIDGQVWRGSEQARLGDPVMGLAIDLDREQVRVRERDGVVSREGFVVAPRG